MQKMLKQDLILQTINQKDHYLKEKNKKEIGFMKVESSRKIMKTFAAMRAKTYSYLTKKNEEDKKAKGTKNVMKRELRLED